jgi:hypothetical protein
MDSLLGWRVGIIPENPANNELPDTIKRDSAEAAAENKPHIITSYLGLGLAIMSAYYLIKRL